MITLLKLWYNFRFKKILDLMDRGIYHRDLLPISGDGSVADIVATRDWNTSLVSDMEIVNILSSQLLQHIYSYL